ncbi:3'(2'),5'-bisphosphate nucleotidase CysQ family protein [Haliangium sp.]|uniref:3'(2'),5'-bisphosphate nucleotidase CysQ family protein n=1 Tax=Haliangium sp. TaxID=2663208 RepID=UPI003D0DBCA8
MTQRFTHSFSHELEVAERLARAAGALALRFHGTDLDIDLKPGNEPVTEADRRTSDLIVAGLREAFPDDVIISEERADDLRRLEAERVWYVDPIDGTKDFIRGLEGFSVMIGLAQHHRPALGVVYQPIHDRLFLAADHGAWFLTPDQPPRQLRTTAIDDPGALRLVASKSSRSHKIDQVKSALGIRNEHNIGSVGLKLCLIAMGERDLYVNPNSLCKAWDTCAPEAILTAAGGAITDFKGRRLRYDREDWRRNSGLVASNGHAHAHVIASLEPLFASA